MCLLQPLGSKSYLLWVVAGKGGWLGCTDVCVLHSLCSGIAHSALWDDERWDGEALWQQDTCYVGLRIFSFVPFSFFCVLPGRSYFHVGFLLRVAE